jgi:polyisoprenoid-binding protein YceI
MRVSILAPAFAAALAFAAAASAQTPAPVMRAVDAARSRAAFSVQHVFVERVTGSVPIVEGTVALGPDSPIPLSVSAELDPSKVASGDRDRDAALASSDFFDAKTFGVWTFTSTKIVPVDASHFGIDGNLTIHGVTQPEHLDVTVRGDAAHPVYRAVGRIDRRAFHMAVTRLDPVIGGTVDVTLDVVLK